MKNLALAFVAGAILAGGVVYLTRPAGEKTAVVHENPVKEAAVPAESVTEVGQPVAEAPAALETRLAPPPVVKKPSPLAQARQQAPAPVTETPAPAPAVEPTPAPVVAPTPAPQPEPEPAPVRVEPRPEPRPAPPPPPEPRKVTIPEGTVVAIQLSERISTETHKDGDTFSGTLSQPLVVEGLVLAERNSRVQGKVTQSVQSGRVKGVAQLGLELTTITTSDKQRLTVQSAPFVKTAETTRGSDAAKVGVGAAIGAAIGAIAGGGKGAAIGAGAGGAAGAGTVAATRGKAAELPVETRISFRLTAPVTVTEKLN
ncbi:MAG: hypothetical protein JNN08_08085 [Bryobacterales bacterium]|nr:hypothetical protein [Bryobacterales bacterium]